MLRPAMSDAFTFESDGIQRVRGTAMAVVAAATWGSWVAAMALMDALTLPNAEMLTYFFGPALWYVAARRWRQGSAGHGSVDWSHEELTVLSGSLRLIVRRNQILGAALFPEGNAAVRLSLADGSELRVGVPDLATGERLLAAMGCQPRERPYTFVGDIRQRAMARAHLGAYAGMLVSLAPVFGRLLGNNRFVALAALVLAPLVALVIAYRTSLRSELRLGADGLLVRSSPPRWVPLASVVGMRTVGGTLVLTLDDRTAVFLHGTSAHEDEAVAAAVTRRLWSLQQSERTTPETAAALAPGGAAASDDAVYRRPSLTRESLLVALHDAALPVALRREAARLLAAQGADGAQAVREASAAWADEPSRQALREMTPP